MAGYADAYIRGLAPLLQMRRMQDAEQAQAQGYALRLQQAQALEAERARQDADRDANQARMVQQMGLQNALGVRGMQVREADLQLRRDADRRRDEADRRAEMDRQRGRLNPGYRWKADNPMEQELIPGSPQEQKMKDTHAADVSRLGMVDEQTGGALDTIGYLLNPKNRGAFNSLFGGYNAKYITQHLPGQTQDAKQKLETLKSNMKASGLQLVRGVGGSPGAITEREWPILEKMIDSLDPMMSEREAANTLASIRDRMAAVQDRTMQEYRQTWEGTKFYQDPLTFNGFKFPNPIALRQYKKALRASEGAK